jgi:hypothetical protein
VKTSVTVRASCPYCGSVGVPARAVSCGIDPAGAGRGLCQFGCPVCARLVFFATDSDTARMLLAQGARPFAGPAPFELLEADGRAPLGWDDALDFHLALSGTPFPQAEIAPPPSAPGSPAARQPPGNRRLRRKRRFRSPRPASG